MRTTLTGLALLVVGAVLVAVGVLPLADVAASPHASVPSSRSSSA
ncbi:hypothetical protein [Sanguibacter massiliensis]